MICCRRNGVTIAASDLYLKLSVMRIGKETQYVEDRGVLGYEKDLISSAIEKGVIAVNSVRYYLYLYS